MKANEAPEKIYLLPRQGGDYAPYWRTDSQDDFGIEYVRTDAFIEKACAWLKEQDEMVGISFEDDFLARFKKYMKGE